MERILKLALLAILLYGGYTFGRPYLEGFFDDIGLGAGGTDVGGPCARQVMRARDSFANQIRDVAPPVDVARWGSRLGMSQGRLSQARSACTCAGEGCDAAREALDSLERLMRRWDDAIRNQGEPPLNSVRALDAIDELLTEARRKGA